MSDRTETAPPAFAVHWRSRDGRGTHVWRDGLTEAEADAQIVWCEGHHPEATLVWSVQSGANQARAIRVKKEARD